MCKRVSRRWGGQETFAIYILPVPNSYIECRSRIRSLRIYACEYGGTGFGELVCCKIIILKVVVIVRTPKIGRMMLMMMMVNKRRHPFARAIIDIVRSYKFIILLSDRFVIDSGRRPAAHWTRRHFIEAADWMIQHRISRWWR